MYYFLKSHWHEKSIENGMMPNKANHKDITLLMSENKITRVFENGQLNSTDII